MTGPTPSIYQLKVTLRDSEPPIWRRMRVPGTVTLRTLHRILQTSMGWDNSHLYEFEVGDIHYQDPDTLDFEEALNSHRATLADAAPSTGSKLTYTYDFGDTWEHDVVVEDITPADSDLRYPICVAGERACPPEDVGGVYGYSEFLEAIRDPDHPEHEAMVEWIGEAWDAEAFDLAGVNKRLQPRRKPAGNRSREHRRDSKSGDG